MNVRLQAASFGKTSAFGRCKVEWFPNLEPAAVNI